MMWTLSSLKGWRAMAYESRTKKTPPAFLKAHFEQAGVVFRAYSAVELEDEQEDPEAPQ